MTKIKKALCAMMVLCLLIIGASSMATVSFAESNELAEAPIVLRERPVEALQEVSGDDTLNTLATLQKPSCTVTTKTVISGTDVQYDPNFIFIKNAKAYNTAVAYEWSTGNKELKLALSSTGGVYSLFDSTYTEFAFATWDDSSKLCKPQYAYGKSYNGSAYSEATTIAWEREFYDSNNRPYIRVMYEYECAYKVVNFYHYAAAMGDIPTEYGTNKSFTWSHNGSSWNTKIRGTIAYKGEISDINVDIPLLGNKTGSVTLGGVTFTMRVTKNQVSIKANKSGLSDNTFYFAFGID